MELGGLDFDVNTTIMQNSSNTTNGTTRLDHYGVTLTVLFSVWLILIIIFAVIGNILVMLAILLDKDVQRKDNGTNLFLFNLAFSDVMTAVCAAPVSLYTLIHEEWHFGSFFCSLNLILNVIFLFTSIHSLMYISIHKYLSVKRLSQCEKRPVNRYVCYGMIAASWIWAVLFALVTTFVLTEAEYKVKTTQCGPKYPIFTVKSVTLSLSNLSINLVLPFIIMLVMYLKIFYIIRGAAVFRRQSSCSDSSLRWTDGEKAAINTLIIVLACFVICWLPYLFYTNYVFFTADKDSIPAFLNPLAYYFGFTNSACNPVIYAFRFPDFKRGYIEILQKFTCCSRSTACESVQKTDGYLREKIDLIDNKADKTKISKDNMQ